LADLRFIQRERVRPHYWEIVLLILFKAKRIVIQVREGRQKENQKAMQKQQELSLKIQIAL
jgi:hypothetical protein